MGQDERPERTDDAAGAAPSRLVDDPPTDPSGATSSALTSSKQPAPVDVSAPRTSRPPQRRKGDQAPPLSPETIEKFLDIQTQDLTLRANEQKLRAQEAGHVHEQAMASLDAQKLVLTKQEENRDRRSKRRFVIVLVSVAAVSIFAVCALLLKSEGVLLEFLKIGGGVATGFLGGYGTAAARHAKKKDESPDSET